MAGKVKEKPSITRKVSEKAKAAPKELLRRGLLTGAEKLQGQLRDASQGGCQEETETDRAQNTARTAARQTAYRLGKLVHGKKKIRTGKLDTNTDAGGTDSDLSAPDFQSGQGDPPGSAEPVQIKIKDAARRFSSADHRHTDPARFESPQVKTKDACIQYQATVPEYDPAIKSAVPSERQTPRAPHRGRQNSIRERPQKISVRETQNNSVPGQINSASEQNHQPSQPLDQGRQKFVRQRQEKAATQRRANSLGPEHVTPAQQRDIGNIQPRHTPTLQRRTGMKILVIESSPHKNGSSNLLADNFIRGAKESGHTVSTFDVARASLHPCLGCEVCGMAGPCCQKDDIAGLKEQMLGSDMVVFVTPLYYFGMSAQLKMVIDRFYSFTGQLSAKGLKTALIVAAWDSRDWTMNDISSHYQTLCRYMNFKDQGMILGFGCGTVSMTERSGYPKKAYALGKSMK